MNGQRKERHSISGVNLQVIRLDLYHVYMQHVFSICMTYVEYCLVLRLYIYTQTVSPSKVRAIASLIRVQYMDLKILPWWTAHKRSDIAVIS